MSSASALRPMGLLEIVDQTFRLYRRNFWLFFGISAVITIPYTVLMGIPALSGIFALLSLPVMLLEGGALTKAVSNRYLGEEATVGGCYRYIGQRFLPLIGTIIVAYLFMLSGVILLFIGMIVFAFWIAFAVQVFVIEDKRYFAAIWRSRFLIGKGVWAELVVLGIIMFVLIGLIQLAVGFAMGAPMYFMAGADLEAAPGLLEMLVSGVLQSLVTPIWGVAIVLLYYDSRIRKEGFDLEVLAREMGSAVPQAAPGAPAADYQAPSPPQAPPGAPANPSGEQSPPPAAPEAPSTEETRRDSGDA